MHDVVGNCAHATIHLCERHVCLHAVSKFGDTMYLYSVHMIMFCSQEGLCLFALMLAWSDEGAHMMYGLATQLGCNAPMIRL